MGRGVGYVTAARPRFNRTWWCLLRTDLHHSVAMAAAINPTATNKATRMSIDVTTDRTSGKTCTTSHGNPMIWRGHLCEGANLTHPRDDNFCLWTRCKSADVPAGKAHEGHRSEVTCAKCLQITD